MRKLRLDTSRWFPRVWDVLGIFLMFLFFTVLVLMPFALAKGVGIFKQLAANGGTSDMPSAEVQAHLREQLAAIGITWGYVVPITLTVIFTVLLFKIRPRFNFRPVYLQLMPVILLGEVFMWMIEEGIMELMPPAEDKFAILKDLILQHPYLAFLTIGVAAPLLEEMLFRGIILKFLLKKYAPWKAIVLSAVIFGAFHLNIWQFVGAFLIGIYMGYLYWRTGSLFYPVLLHFLNNSISFYIVWKTHTVDTGFLPEDNKRWLPLIILTGLIGFTAVMVYLDKYFERFGKRTIYVATSNPHKLAEMQAMMPSHIRLKSLKDLKHRSPLIESGDTLEENSLMKAYQIAKRYGVDVMADDTGLEVEALDGRPGVHSARFAGEQATDEQNRQKLLRQLDGVGNRQARFRTVITLSDGHRWYQFEGTVPGRIATEEQGEGGFGYDALFIPEGANRTFAQMSAEEKNRISHRARAVKRLVAFLEKEDDTQIEEKS